MHLTFDFTADGFQHIQVLVVRPHLLTPDQQSVPLPRTTLSRVLNVAHLDVVLFGLIIAHHDVEHELCLVLESPVAECLALEGYKLFVLFVGRRGVPKIHAL